MVESGEPALTFSHSHNYYANINYLDKSGFEIQIDKTCTTENKRQNLDKSG